MLMHWSIDWSSVDSSSSSHLSSSFSFSLARLKSIFRSFTFCFFVLTLFRSEALSFWLTVSLALVLSFSLYYLSVLCILPQSLPMTLFLFVKCSLASSVFHLIILYQNPYIKVRCIFEYRFKFSTQFPNTNYCSQKDGCFWFLMVEKSIKPNGTPLFRY